MEIDPIYLSIIVGIVVGILTGLYFLLRSFGKAKDTILIVGLSDSGKTHMFAKIANSGASPITYTSFKENIVNIDVKDQSLKIVDFPGAERLRKQLIEKWLKNERSSIKSIVFVVDSSSFSKRVRDVAEFLYDVALESGKKIPILTACNKQDISLAKSCESIQSAVEKEIGLINKTRAAALTTTDGSTNRNTLTDTGSKFQWSDLPTKIEFVECSASSDEKVGLDAVRDWIKQH